MSNSPLENEYFATLQFLIFKVAVVFIIGHIWYTYGIFYLIETKNLHESCFRSVFIAWGDNQVQLSAV